MAGQDAFTVILNCATQVAPAEFISSLTSTTTDKHDMALSSGIYTIRNVKHRNWAMLLDGNDEGEVVAGSSDTPNVGEKVRP
jgi:hypothetical protein